MSCHTFRGSNSSLSLLVLSPLWLNSTLFSPLSNFSLSMFFLFSPQSAFSFSLPFKLSSHPQSLTPPLPPLSPRSFIYSSSSFFSSCSWDKPVTAPPVKAMRSDIMKEHGISLLTWRFTSSRLSTAPRSLLLWPLCFFFMHRHSLNLITWKGTQAAI